MNQTPLKWKSLSYVQLFATPWTVVCQAPLSLGFSSQEYWSGLLCPPPGDLPKPGIKPPESPALQVNSLLLNHQGWSERERESHSMKSYSLQPHGLYSPWNSPGQNNEWIAFPFSRGSSQPRDRTQVSHIAGRFFTSWTTRDYHLKGARRPHVVSQLILPSI